MNALGHFEEKDDFKSEKGRNKTNWKHLLVNDGADTIT